MLIWFEIHFQACFSKVKQNTFFRFGREGASIWTIALIAVFLPVYFIDNFKSPVNKDKRGGYDYQVSIVTISLKIC